MPNTAEHTDLKDVRHIKHCGSKQTYCGHPRQCGIYNFGGGEIAVVLACCLAENRDGARSGRSWA